MFPDSSVFGEPEAEVLVLVEDWVLKDVFCVVGRVGKAYEGAFLFVYFHIY